MLDKPDREGPNYIARIKRGKVIGQGPWAFDDSGFRRVSGSARSQEYDFSQTCKAGPSHDVDTGAVNLDEADSTARKMDRMPAMETICFPNRSGAIPEAAQE